MFQNIGIRFRDQYYNDEKPDALLEKFKAKQNIKSNPFVIQIAYHSVFLKTPEKDHKWWSPELTVNIEEHENGSKIKEVSGPNPGTFTFAMFVIIFSIVISFFALMFVFSQIQLGTSPHMSLLVIGASIVLAVSVIVILGVGRRKAQPQMQEMKDFVKKVL